LRSLKHVHIFAAFGIGVCYFVGQGGLAGPQGAFLANLFPTHIRLSGMTVSRELNGMLIAGPTPLADVQLSRSSIHWLRPRHADPVADLGAELRALRRVLFRRCTGGRRAPDSVAPVLAEVRGHRIG
jgi:hypothetical protein